MTEFVFQTGLGRQYKRSLFACYTRNVTLFTFVFDFQTGYGKSKKYDVKDTTQFMLDLMKVLHFDNANKPILVSPSMSGRFSVPLYMKHPEVFQGYIPVAPVSVSEYKPDQYKSSKVGVNLTTIFGFAVICCLVMVSGCRHSGYPLHYNTTIQIVFSF